MLQNKNTIRSIWGKNSGGNYLPEILIYAIPWEIDIGNTKYFTL